MKRFLSAMLGFVILCVFPLSAALAEFEENPFETDEENPFAWGEVDPEAFAQEYEDDPFASFLEDDPSLNAYSDNADDDSLFAFVFGEDGSNLSASDDHDSDDVAPTPAPGASGSLTATINGENLTLSFDPSPVFSTVSDTMVQAAFYTYGDTTGNLYELYLNFPTNVRAGDTLDPEYAMKYAQDSSVMLLISNANDDDYYIASQLQNEVFPDTSSYAVHFDNVYTEGDTTTYVGSLNATMVSYDVTTGNIGGSVVISDATFNFTMSNTPVEVDPGDSGDHSFTDFPSIAPFATPTLAPDYRKV